MIIFLSHCVLLFFCFFFSFFTVEVGVPPLQRGVQGAEAERGSEGRIAGARHSGPHPHSGEGSVRAGAAAAGEPLPDHSALRRSLQGQLTL